MSKEDRLVGLSGSAAGTPVEESAKATRERVLHGGVLHCARVTLRRLAELSGVCVADPRALLQVGEAIGEPECIDKPTPDGIPCENQKLFKTCGRSWMVQVRALLSGRGSHGTPRQSLQPPVACRRIQVLKPHHAGRRVPKRRVASA